MAAKYNTDHTVLTFAKQAMREVREVREAYEAEVAEWSAKGFRAPQCVHGANMWVDHDIPCGACEEGASDYEVALSIAHDRAAEWQAMFDASVTARGLFSPEVFNLMFAEVTLLWKRYAGK